MNSRLPHYILGLLVLIAIVYRLVNPPPPMPPGPIGSIPTWISRAKLGDMVASAVSPSGTMWAGAWNEKTKSGRLQSAVWVIDLEKVTAKSCELEKGSQVSSLSWADDNTVRVLRLDSQDPVETTVSEVDYIDAATGRIERTVELAPKVARVFAWPAGSPTFVGQMASAGAEAKAVQLSESAKAISKPAEIALNLPSDTQFGKPAAMSLDGGLFVFSVAEDEVGGNDTYYLVDAKSLAVKRVFNSKDIAGRVEGLWVSPAGILVMRSERDKLAELRYDPATGKLDVLAKAAPIDVAKSWPDAPKHMMFVSYNGGYDFNLATRRVKQLFDFSKQDKYSDYWREQVQDGRLYPRKDGNYTAISERAGEIDIRTIKKNGDLGAPILPRS